MIFNVVVVAVHKGIPRYFLALVVHVCEDSLESMCVNF